MAKEMICRNCGHQGKPKRITKGSILIEIILWIFFIVPGVIYSLWRLTTRSLACPHCRQQTMIPIDSPIGRELLSK
jgi:hypothetical protein